VDWAGAAPLLVGVYQVNFQVPELPPGVYPVQVASGGRISNAVTIAVH
jgi:uncharacterized protein (TIGR03437 family)